MTTTLKSKCCGADVSHAGFKPQSNIPVYVCVHCDFTCDLQDQPTSRLDENKSQSLIAAIEGDWNGMSKEDLILTVKMLTNGRALWRKEAERIHQSLTKANEELVELRKSHSYFVSAMHGAFYGLLTHPSDVPLNGCLISEPSKEKMREIYKQVLKEKQAIDSAIAAQEKMK